MVTIKAEFEYEGKTYKLQAKLTNDGKLSNSKGNMASDIIDYEDGFYGLVFEDVAEDFFVELAMYANSFEAQCAILWRTDADCILAAVDPIKQQTTFR